MVSVDGLLDAHEVVVRARVEELRGALADAERDLEHVVITRDTLRAVVAGQAAVIGPDDAAESGMAGQGAVTRAVAEPSVVPARREGMTGQELPEGYRRLWVQARSAEAGVRAMEMVRVLGLPETPAKSEGMRSKLKRLAARGWAVEAAPGLFRMV